MVHQHPAMAGGGEAAPVETASAEAAPAETAPAASLSPPPFDKRGLPKEVGVNVILKGRLAEVDRELVGWQSGGALKHVATLGLDKGHVNGKVMNAKNPLQLARPVIFVIKTPEGTSATEYQLLQLYEKENRREFRAMTGGVIHSSGGGSETHFPLSPKKSGTASGGSSSRDWRKASTDSCRQGFPPPASRPRARCTHSESSSKPACPRWPRRKPDPASVLRHLRIDAIRPGENSTRQVVDLLEPSLPQEVDCLGAARPGAAMGDDLAAGIEFAQALW
jgi:hypothetical protein